MTLTESATSFHEHLVHEHSAHNYHPLPVVVANARGAWVTDVEGRRYLDCLAGYSALNFGHGHPDLLAAAHRQLDRVTLTSRAFGSDQLGPFCAELSALLGKQMVLPMNTGAEAVESGIKVARKWGYEVKGVPEDRAQIVVMAGGFHGRTTTIVGFSTDPDARGGFGPFTPGFVVVPYGADDPDRDALRAAITPDTVAVLVEPIQGEAGVVVPPAGYLPAVRAICDEARVLFVADEVQAGLGRTGRLLATRAAGVDADVYLLGKALGGGIMPLSAVVADADVLGVLQPGQHGSTFGGNPLACAVGRAVLTLLADEGPDGMLARARRLGDVLHTRLAGLVGHGVLAVRGMGLWAGVDIEPRLGTGRAVSEAMMRRGVLVKDTHGSSVRLSPPLVITEAELHAAVDALEGALADLA
ncbi:ornithine--oxo-acid transaminase [Pseudonocardia sp.]|jgi:ornithine--oxo-acid transaminase|uniref:ornithine--oxo-acid transaminase n=1 Tax=Pseudonocardia sp. TaxID=60912 RepID=UPI00260D29BE|nr:ornithine--oxo-acid transaminase [Pseudonocardia sp.]MCW2719770.1 ornithine aminotransferase [Pseudonocardia sp.]MDT7616228.1 ornithine--oxo-acid transaminase [Pseudonocardiales bacterium]